MPRVTVLMPVRNQADSLPRAMQSILQQSWRDLQLLVLDDGSEDGSGHVAEAVQDPRVVVCKSDQAVGLPEILNRGLALSDSEFVARMDADDWSHPQRLSAQIVYLTQYTDVAACGTAVTVCMPDGSSRVRHYPTSNAAIRARLLFENAIAHPASMLRRSVLDSLELGYDPAYPKSQDYDLWERLARQVKLANLSKSYLEYRVQSRGPEHFLHQRELADRIRLRQIEALGMRPTPSEWELHRALCAWDGEVMGRRAAELEDWLLHLIEANEACRLYEHQFFRDEVLTRFRRLCRLINKGGKDGWRYWHSASTLRSGEFRFWDYLHLPVWHRARLTAPVRRG